MKLVRSVRKQICRALIGTLLLAQFSVASYACPSMSDQAMVPAAVATESAEVAMGMPEMNIHAGNPSVVSPAVDQIDTDAAALCVEHCRFGQQSNASTPAPAVHAAFLVPLYALLPAPAVMTVARAQAAAERPMAKAAPPPIAILHCCFRI